MTQLTLPGMQPAATPAVVLGDSHPTRGNDAQTRGRVVGRAIGGCTEGDPCRPWQREAARIIRRAVWQKGRVPSSPDRYPWSMARELHAWRRIIERHGIEPELLNGALLHLRELYPNAKRVTCLFARPGLLGDALAAAKAARARRERPAAVFFDPSSRVDATPVAAPRQLSDVLKGIGL